ncbi:MAG: hypothetical protein UV60_C0001G0045 [Parcubacteria group bacterium GW2011_GWA2_43_11]|nr:MAG: hypothetical protein UU89_C0025G0013 [Parcubacteria group bacterium GW2011_GWC2_42_11]KKS86446.1 MAG: hypothetical protein UV60_C0001G0045 [Parcubacteria group bacterium GW2011_GWA2_43_11]
MKTKATTESVVFSLRVVLTVVFGRTLSRNIEEAYNFLTFLTGLICTAENYEQLRTACTPHIFRLYPSLDSPDMHRAYSELVTLLDTEEEKKYPDLVIFRWMSKLLLKMNSIDGAYEFTPCSFKVM